ncbi:MAG: XRE family transcriptional regulator, partial [Hymenobacter sp.]
MPNSSSVGQRFSQLIQQLGMSKNAFAMSLDKTATVIQHLVDERNKPGFDLMNKVFEVYPNVSVDWLLRGHGPMMRDSPSEPVAVAASPVAAPTTTAPPRVAPATLGFPAPLFTVSAASQPSAEAPVPPAEPVVAVPPAETAAPPAASQPLPIPALVEVPQPLPV